MILANCGIRIIDRRLCLLSFNFRRLSSIPWLVLLPLPSTPLETMSEQQNAAAGPSSSTAAQQPSTPTSTAAASDSTDVIRALGNLLKSQTGETHTNERISSILLSNMANLVQQGKITQKQIIAVRVYILTSGWFWAYSDWLIHVLFLHIWIAL